MTMTTMTTQRPKSSPTSAPNNSDTDTESSPPARHADDFMATVDFRRLFVGFVHDSRLMKLRLTTRAWKAVAEEVIDDGVASGAMIVHSGKGKEYARSTAEQENQDVVTWVVFLLNITKVVIGAHACQFSRLVVVEIPEGVERIGEGAFSCCFHLTDISFPTTLTFIEKDAFCLCSSLANIDPPHKPSKIRSICIRRVPRTNVDDDPGLASRARWCCLR